MLWDADLFMDIIKENKYSLSENVPFLLDSTVGFIIMGKITTFKKAANNNTNSFDGMTKSTKSSSTSCIKATIRRTINVLAALDNMLVHEKRVPPQMRCLDQVAETIAGTDRCVSAVRLKAAAGNFTIPVVKISPLPRCD